MNKRVALEVALDQMIYDKLSGSIVRVNANDILYFIDSFDGGCEVMPRQADVDMVFAVLSEMRDDLQGDFGFSLTPQIIHKLYGVLLDSAPYAKQS